MSGDRAGEFAGVLRWPTELAGERFSRHLGADPGPVIQRHRGVAPLAAGGVQCGDPAGHLDPELIDSPGDPKRVPNLRAAAQIFRGVVAQLAHQHRPSGFSPAPNRACICSWLTTESARVASIDAHPEPTHNRGSRRARCRRTPGRCCPSRWCLARRPDGSGSHSPTRPTACAVTSSHHHKPAGWALLLTPATVIPAS